MLVMECRFQKNCNMKYLITPHNLNNLNKLIAANGFVIGNSRFSARITNSFEEAEINQIIDFAKDEKKEVFLNFNKMFVNNDFLDFDLFLSKLKLDLVKGIIIADLGLLKHLVEKGLTKQLIYNPETLLTNQFDFNFLSNLKIQGAFMSKEITINQIIEIIDNKKYRSFYYGHGHMNMFYSKRQLISNFAKYYNLDLNSNALNYSLTEPHRLGRYFPVLEDQAGTHIFRDKVLNSFEILDQLNKLDYFLIDTIFKDDNYGVQILDLYLNGFNQDKVNKIKQKYHEEWDLGFYLKTTLF